MSTPFGSSERIACAIIDLPEPDSPTRQTTSLRLIANETCSTANGRSPPSGSAIERFSTESTDGGFCAPVSVMPAASKCAG